ncbi:hypothetical protein [Rubricoccus marinus]|uniref:Lipoprotein n=1 Tax=Rubricoccus marinus TaxID=716817 RepID=A0A259U0J0_9BACT|nr:hypothetical protein [Rubricoccus marinus]OZC03358.1 hypothetical protein BSZ36_10415 [Rubricoccus marinus]
MRRVSLLILLSCGLASCSAPAPVRWSGGGGSKAEGKVSLCHDGKTIRVDGSEVRAHLLHGDQRGACRG